MKVHHLNCGTMCPFGGRIVNDSGSAWFGKLICHVLAIETNDGIVLVDTGIGLLDIEQHRLGGAFEFATRAKLDPEETALRQLEKLGFSQRDVRHIVPTHFDLDHMGGVSDFPAATVHAFADEHAAAMHPKTANERQRYRASQWSHNPTFKLYSLEGDTTWGFSSVRALGSVAEVLFIPTAGHTRGHCAVAVNTDKGWLLHVGDAMFDQHELEEPPRCGPGLRLFQSSFAVDNRARIENQARLRELHKAHPEISMFCAHDPRGLPVNGS